MLIPRSKKLGESLLHLGFQFLTQKSNDRTFLTVLDVCIKKTIALGLYWEPGVEATIRRHCRTLIF